MIVDQRQNTNTNLATQAEYWQAQFSDPLPVLELPLDHARPPVQSFVQSSETIELSVEDYAELTAFCAQENESLFVTLLAALKIWLMRSVGQEDIVVGSAAFNGQDNENGSGSATHANPVAMRTNLAGNLDVKAALKRVAETVAGTAKNRHYVFDELVASLPDEEQLDRAPIFQVMLVPCNIPYSLADVPISEADLFDIGEYTSRCDLVFIVSDENGVLKIKCEYDEALFEASSIQRILGHFQTLLSGIVANSQQPLSALQILTEAEQSQQVVKVSESKSDSMRDVCIHAWFEAQAAQSPDAVAVVLPATDSAQDESESLTYQALNRRANQVAHHLQAFGIGPEDLVGLCMERSVDMVVSILGILKAGGAYLPLDLAYPKERLGYILEDSAATVLLTQESLIEKLPEFTGSVICVDTGAGAIAQWSDENPTSSVIADNLAYVIYTSGSTGKPKGTLITHANVTRLFTETQDWYQFDTNDVWTLFHSYAFDFSVWELWGALLYGGRLVVVPYWVSRSPQAFYELLCQEQVTVLNQTPSAFRQLIQAEEQGDSPADALALRYVIFGGEALELQSLRPWFERHGDEKPQLVNMYGITETTVHVTYRPLSMADVTASTGSVIGGPIPDLQLFILGQNQQFVPFRVPGELNVGGAGLARGYLNRPDLTATKFIPNPYSDEPGARLYRSGDLARLLPDGDVEYAGRIDHQVKIRGFRVELGEIEAALGQHPAVHETVVLVREDRPDEQRLVAYVVVDQTNEPSISELQDFVGEKVPDYMVPAAFVILDTLPLTPNGKVDRKALPQPEWTRPELNQAFAAPRTAVEEVLAGIWIDVLGLDRVGIHDNFFELGGHSLLATQVVSRLYGSLKIELPLRHIFEAPTLADLAERIEAILKDAEGLSAPAMGPVPRDGTLPLSFGQQRLWFVDQLTPGQSAYNFHTALQLTGRLDIDACEQALNEIVRRHEILRTNFAIEDGQPIQVIHEAGAHGPYLVVTDLSNLDEEAQAAKVQQLTTEEARHPFDLAQEPLIRTRLLKLGPDSHWAILVMHHIAADGWSLGIFVREFATLYEAYTNNAPSPLPALPIQYADFAHWQRQWMQGEVLQRHVDYWKRQLTDLPTLALPADKPRPAEQTFRGAHETLQLSAELSEALRDLSQREGVTMFMTLLAAFQTLLARYSGQDDIVVGADIANRNRRETENLIGFFANQLVLRTDLSGNPTFRTLLGRVREVAFGAYAHQDLSFEKLVEELQPQRDPSRNPLFQVMFILQNAPAATLTLPNLTLQGMPIEQETTAFDITLSITEDPKGIYLACRYYSDLFEAATIQRMLKNYDTLLQSIVAEPKARIKSLNIQTEAESKEKAMEKTKRKQSKFDKLKKLKPKRVNLVQDNLIKTNFVQPDQTMPLVIQPAIEGVDLLSWAESNRHYVDKEIAKYGALLFRGFNIESIDRFEAFTRKLSPELMDYSERSSPRSQVQGAVFTSTDHPADQPIVLHNEQSYTLNWMMKLWFYCAQPAITGGGTPIADSRNIYNRLSPALIEKFTQKQVLYRRNYGIGMGLSWHEAFQTQDRAQVEAHCQAANITCAWLDDNRLRTEQVRPAIRQHPKTGETIWFNHALFFHVTSLEPETRDALLAGYDEDDLPFNTYYGDATPFEPEVLDEIRDAFNQETKHFIWQQNDILMVDNMLVAHGRQSFEGPRKVVVAMAEPYQQISRLFDEQPTKAQAELATTAS